jgi:nucleoside-diphosphate-sugar epimerase
MTTLKGKHVLVTGATGFIGKNLVRRLMQEEVHISALVLPGEALPAEWGEAVTVIRGDITDPAAAEEATKDVEIVFHLVAYVGDWGPQELFSAITVGGTRNILDHCAQHKAHAILVSSVVVYGTALGKQVCHEDLPWGQAVGPYSASKQEQELLARQIASRTGMPLTVIRPTNVFGPHCKPWVHDVVRQLKTGKPALVAGGGQNAALCNVENLVEALVLAATNKKAIGQIYNIHDDSAVTWSQYFGDLASAVSAPTPRSIPYTAAKWAAILMELTWKLLRKPNRPPLTREALNLVGSDHQVPIDRAREDLGFSPAPDSYARGLAAIKESL